MKARQDTGRKNEMNVKLKHSTPLHICSDAIRQCWQSGESSDTDLMARCFECGELYAPTDEMCPNCECENLHHTEMVCGEKDKALIDRVGNKFKHASTLEHLTYNFEIDGISRACLQELARHRMASLSVKSTRYTLKELKEDDLIEIFSPKSRTEAHKLSKEGFCVFNAESSANAKHGAYHKKSFEKYIVFTGNEYVDLHSVTAVRNLRYVLKDGISNDIAKYCLPESYKTSLTWTINARSLQNFLSLRSDKSALWEIQKLAHAVYDSLPIEHKYLFEDHIKNS